MKTVFTYAHVKWFYGQSERAYYLNYFINSYLKHTYSPMRSLTSPYLVTVLALHSGFTLWLYTLVEYYYPSDVRALTTPLVLDVFYLASQGVPTHDHTGEPLSGKLIKKLKKMYQQQEKLYNSVGAGQVANGSTEN